MRSLTLKLTLAFILVGIIGSALVAFLVGVQTQRAFNQFVLNRYEQELLDGLTAYYAQFGTWEGVEIALARAGARSRLTGDTRDRLAPLALLDESSRVLLGRTPYRLGQQVDTSGLTNVAPIVVDNEEVGALLLAPRPARPVPVPDSPEFRFLSSVQRAIVVGAAVALLVAVLTGLLLARNLSRPLRDLTVATRRMSTGELGVQVPVRTADELGELSSSFNRMSAELARLTQSRRQMTADIAHDLRTPLSVILGYTEALSDGKLPGTPQTYEVIHREAQHLRHLVDDLRILSLADAGELPLNRRPQAPHALLERTAAAYGAQAAESEVALVVEAQANLPAVYVDPERMAQVLGNLVSNALRHTEAGGQVTLSATAAADQVLLNVADTGSGIDPADLPHIFSRFYRGDEVRSHDGSSGLGLAIARSLVQSHEGKIAVNSRPGEGTAFTISLPSASAES